MYSILKNYNYKYWRYFCSFLELLYACLQKLTKDYIQYLKMLHNCHCNLERLLWTIWTVRVRCGWRIVYYYISSFGFMFMVFNATNFRYIMAVSFIGGGNRSTRRKRWTCSKSLTNFITKCCIEYTSHWAGF